MSTRMIALLIITGWLSGATALDAPRNVQVDFVMDSWVMLSWDPVDGARSYSVEGPDRTIWSNAPTHTLNRGLSGGQTYTLTVRAHTSSSTSDGTPVQVTMLLPAVAYADRTIMHARNFEDKHVDGYVPYYQDDWGGSPLAIDPNQYPWDTAAAETPFSGEPGTYDVYIMTNHEIDGDCTYKLTIGDVRVVPDLVQPTHEGGIVGDQARAMVWRNVTVPSSGVTIQVRSNAHSNELVGQSGTHWARGRWQFLLFDPVGPTSVVSPDAVDFSLAGGQTRYRSAGSAGWVDLIGRVGDVAPSLQARGMRVHRAQFGTHTVRLHMGRQACRPRP